MVAVKFWLPATSSLVIFALASVLNAGVIAVESLSSLLKVNNPYFATYQQVIKDVNGEIIETSQGQVGIRGKEIRWVISKPFEQVIIVSDGKISIYDPDLAQVIHRSVEESFYINPMSLLIEKNFDLANQFNVESMVTDLGLFFSLTPIEEGVSIPKFDLLFENAVLKELKISDDFGQEVDIKFYPSTIDIENDVFRLDLKALEDVDVIGER